MDHLAPLAPMARLSDANGCSVGTNGDSVSGANGDPNSLWCQWQHPLASMVIVIDDHWRHLINLMAILNSQSPFRVSGSFGNPIAINLMTPLTTMVTMAIICDNGTNCADVDSGANSDEGDSLVPLVPLSQLAPLSPLVPMVAFVPFSSQHDEIWHHCCQ